MALTVSIGSAQALNGREAGLQATHQALNRMGSASPAFGVVIASHQYQAREVVGGVSGLLGDTPIIGFSSPAGLTNQGIHPNSVVVALMAGDFKAETHWLPGYAQSARETGAKLSKAVSDHNSVLGHGFEPVKAERVQQLYDIVLKLTGVSESFLPKFPTLNL